MAATYDPQLLKGVLTLLLLRLLAERESYGYEVVQRLREVGLSGISEGTVYPALAAAGTRGPHQCPTRVLERRTRTQVLPTHPGRTCGPHGRNRQLAIPGQPGQCRLDSPNALRTH